VSFRRLAAMILVFLGTSLASTVLGSSLIARAAQYSVLEQEIRLLRELHRQIAPDAWVARLAIDVEPAVAWPTFGSTITIGAVVTPFVRMQMTARVSWDQVSGVVVDRQTWESSHAGYR
jgi:hypothetical protein